MKLEKKYLLIVLLAIAFAIPVSLALGHRGHLLKVEKSNNNNLQIQLNSKQKELQLKNTQIQQEQQKNADLEKQNADKDKQLQSKRETAQRLAAAQAQPAPVANYAGAGDCEAFRGIVAQYNWNVNTALAVMKAESGCNPLKDNLTDGHPTCTGSYGLFNIGCDSTGGLSIASLHDPATNIAHAYAMYASRGWQPWSFTTCAYKVACV